MNHPTDLLAHLFPGFDAWWPNEIAAAVWLPFAALGGWLLKRYQDRRHAQHTEELAEIHRLVRALRRRHGGTPEPGDAP